MSKAKNISGNSEEKCAHQVSGGELYVGADVVKIIDNLVQLHRLYGALLTHLEREVGELQALGVLPETGCETDIKAR